MTQKLKNIEKYFFDKYFIFIKVFSYPDLNRKPRICAVSDIRTPLYMVHTSLGLSKGHWKLNYWKLRKTCSNELIRTSRLFLYLVPCVWVPSSTTTREGQQNERTESQRVREQKNREKEAIPRLFGPSTTSHQQHPTKSLLVFQWHH